MPPLQVKEFPEDVYERLRVCATEENRSISNQAFTIIKDFLDARDSGMLEVARIPGQAHIIIYRYDGEARIGERRRKVFERIKKLDPIPHSERTPRTDIILAQIREEEAR